MRFGVTQKRQDDFCSCKKKMKRQVHKIIGVLLSVYLSCFLTSRVVFLAEEYQKASIQLQEDINHQNLCSDQFIMAQLGQRGTEGCKESKLGSRIIPLFSALRTVADNTYVCGNTPCASLWHDMTSTTSSTVALVCCVVLSPSGLYQAAKWILNRRRRHKHDNLHEYEEFEEDDRSSLIVPLFSSNKAKMA